jgi:uncharacterized protein (DUF488 family)
MDLYTIGFTHKSAEQFFGLLRQAGVRRVLDIRLSNTSQLAGFTKAQDLPYFLHALCGAEYVHEPRLAPTRELMERYRKLKGGRDEFRAGYLKLLAQRRVADTLERGLLEGPTALLCAEVDAQQCHRSFAVEYLARRWPELRPVHL